MERGAGRRYRWYKNTANTWLIIIRYDFCSHQNVIKQTYSAISSKEDVGDRPMTGLIQSKKQLLLHENEITGGKSIITNVHEVINAWSHSFLKKKNRFVQTKVNYLRSYSK